MTMDEAAKMYFDLKQGLMRPSSFANLQRLFRDHIQPQIGKVQINDITNRELQKFYNSLVTEKCKNSDKTLSVGVIKDIVGLAKIILYFAMEEGEMQERRYKLRSPYGMRRNENGQDEYLSEEYYKKILTECANIQSACKKRAKPKIFVLLALTTGMRNGEICGLQWQDINFSDNTLSVKRTVQRIETIDGAGYVNIGEPKSAKSERTVIMPDITSNTLKKYKTMLNIQNDNYYVLGSERPTEPRTMRESYRRLLKYLQIPYIRPHALRHTFATYMIGNGGDVKTTSMLLGHANTAITLDTYTHVTKKQKEKTFHKINELFCENKQL